jgi:hypothetical protein
MNERIKELTKQAGISILYEYDGYDGHAAVANLTDIEKFAELIVRECIGIVEKNESEMHYDNGMYPVYPTVCEIREHFGVEE